MKLLVLILLPVLTYGADTGTKTIVALGDSLTAGYGVAKVKAYPQLLEDSLKEKGYSIKVINAGISGSTSAGALKRLKWFKKVKPEILILALGANDGLRGLPVQKMKENLDKAIRFAKENGMKVIIAGMMIPNNYGEKYRTEFAAVFPSLAKAHSISLMPFLLKDVATKAELNLPDGIHPNEKGYEVLVKNLLPYVEKLL